MLRKSTALLKPTAHTTVLWSKHDLTINSGILMMNHINYGVEHAWIELGAYSLSTRKLFNATGKNHYTSTLFTNCGCILLYSLVSYMSGLICIYLTLNCSCLPGDAYLRQRYFHRIHMSGMTCACLVVFHRRLVFWGWYYIAFQV